jgi:hypothetical protein
MDWTSEVLTMGRAPDLLPVRDPDRPVPGLADAHSFRRWKLLRALAGPGNTAFRPPKRWWRRH